MDTDDSAPAVGVVPKDGESAINGGCASGVIVAVDSS